MSDDKSKVVTGENLDRIFNDLKVECTFKAEGWEYCETFVYDGITLKNLAIRCARKDVIARGQMIGKIESPEKLDAFRAEGAHRLSYKDSTKVITTKADRAIELRAILAGMTADEKAEYGIR